jgi:7-cyano-7-deazaguanine synthase
MKKAVVLLSGGLDSATVLYHALSRGYRARALIFSYGQRHRKEIFCARKIARAAGCAFDLVELAMPWKGSSLLDASRALPDRGDPDPRRIPSTYVPARNIIFLSLAASCAEATGARVIFIGANAVDYSGYPDCRPEFFQAFRRVLRQGTKAGAGGRAVRVEAPLLRKTKAQIIRRGIKLGVPYGLTWSCYQGGVKPCGRCESCRLRARGFAGARVTDPLRAG